MISIVLTVTKDDEFSNEVAKELSNISLGRDTIRA